MVMVRVILGLEIKFRIGWLWGLGRWDNDGFDMVCIVVFEL